MYLQHGHVDIHIHIYSYMFMYTNKFINMHMFMNILYTVPCTYSFL